MTLSSDKRTADRHSSTASSSERARGFSLVELMVALAIGLVIIAAIGRIFLSSRSTSQADEGLARLQENARFAIDAMQREIRMAGYFGCLRDLSRIENDLKNPGNFEVDLKTAIQGYEYTGTGAGGSYTMSNPNPTPVGVSASNWSPALPASLQNKVLPGTDVVVIRHMGGTPMRLTVNASGNYNSDSQVFVADTPAVNDYAAGDIVVVSDCSKATVFQISAISNDSGGGNTWKSLAHASTGTPGNDCNIWGTGTHQTVAGNPPCVLQEYQNGGEVSKAVTTIFYVGTRTAGTTGPALFRATLKSDGTLDHQEIVEGVENIQIMYGLDTATTLDGYANQYISAAAVTTWDKIVSVRIGVLMRTTGNVDQVADTGTYLLTANTAAAGVTIDPANDKRRRRVFTTTIQLRNRLPTS